MREVFYFKVVDICYLKSHSIDSVFLEMSAKTTSTGLPNESAVSTSQRAIQRTNFSLAFVATLFHIVSFEHADSKVQSTTAR